MNDISYLRDEAKKAVDMSLKYYKLLPNNQLHHNLLHMLDP